MVDKPNVSQYKQLFKSVGKQLRESEGLANDVAMKLAPSLEWLGYYLTFYRGVGAVKLAESAYSAAVEAASLVSFGFARSSVFSLRCHYEYYLMFMYYKDHPVEWAATENYRESLKLPGDLKKYFRQYGERFNYKWSILSACRTRHEEDYYELLSAISHGSALDSQPNARSPPEMIAAKSVLIGIPTLAGSVSENLFDLSVSFYDGAWTSLPTDVRSRLTARMKPVSARSKLFD